MLIEVLQHTYDSLVYVVSGKWVRCPVPGDPDVVLRSPDGDRGFLCETQGLGFVIDQEALVLTCAHCVLYRDPDEVFLVTKGKTVWSSGVKAISLSRDLDVAVIEATQPFSGAPVDIAS